MKVEDWSIDKVTPYPNNPRDNDDAVPYVANSIKEFGFQQPIVVDKDGVVIVGHTRLKAAKKLGLTRVPVIVADSLSEDQARAYRLVDNKTNEFADWNSDQLIAELSKTEMDMSPLGFIDSEVEPEIEHDETYTMKVDVPQYQITGAEPDIDMLFDTTKTDELVEEIEQTDLPEEIAEFLKVAATRHTKFNYANIAEYYAHADEKVQRLFEDSALVIIDYNDAMRDGYVKLSDQIEQMRIEQDE